MRDLFARSNRRGWAAALLMIPVIVAFCWGAVGCSSGAEAPAGSGLSEGEQAEPSAQTPTLATISASPEPGERLILTRWDLWAGGETILRGVNLYQSPAYPELGDWLGSGSVGPPVTQEDCDAIAAAGVNYVNLSHPGLFTEKPPFVLDEGIQANLDSLLEMLAEADLFAVISFRTGPGRSELGFWGVSPDDEVGMSLLNDTVWEDRAAQAAWAEMWRYTAERYRDNPVVVGYDLMVEPNANAVFFEIYWPPDFYPAYAGTLYDWNQFYPRIVEAIREVDPDMPVLVGAMSWSSLDWLPYLEPSGDPRTVYTFHQYAPHDYTHQEPELLGRLPITYPGELDLDWDGRPDPFDRAWLEGWLSTAQAFMAEHKVPVAANEFGAQRYEPGAAQYLNDVMALFEELGINYALWSWTPAYWMQWETISSFEFRLGPDPDNRTEFVPSEMWDVITSYWSKNTLRPSMVEFAPAEE
jgi:hypothetical protein